MKDPFLKFDTVSHAYSDHGVKHLSVSNIDFVLDRGETCAIIGPSGCGKTTLLYLASGLLKPTVGEVTITQQVVKPKRKKTAIILQDYGLLPWKTVWDNIALGLHLRKVPQDEIDAKVSEMIQTVGLSKLEKRFPASLSGGQRQRVGIARALVLEPDLLLMDEPFSALDAFNRENLQNLFLSLWQKHQFAALFVTHDIDEASFLGQKIFVLSSYPANVSAEFNNPQMGSIDYRSDPAFHTLCDQLRTALKDVRAYEPC